MIRLSEISAQCKSLRFKQMHVVCCLVPICLLCCVLFTWGRCYPARVQQPVLNLAPGSQLGGDLLKICEKDELRRIRFSKQDKIYGQIKYEYVEYCNCKLVFFPQGNICACVRERMVLSLTKKDICQRKTTKATTYYSAVMHECESICCMLCLETVVLSIHKHR